MQALRRQLLDSLRRSQGIYRNRSLRRLQLAWIGSSSAPGARSIALMVYAYRKAAQARSGSSADSMVPRGARGARSAACSATGSRAYG
jgi:hypothetical protein